MDQQVVGGTIEADFQFPSGEVGSIRASMIAETFAANLVPSSISKVPIRPNAK